MDGLQKNVIATLALLLATGIMGYFFTRGSGIRYLFAHMAALALVGLLANLAARSPLPPPCWES